MSWSDGKWTTKKICRRTAEYRCRATEFCCRTTEFCCRATEILPADCPATELFLQNLPSKTNMLARSGQRKRALWIWWKFWICQWTLVQLLGGQVSTYGQRGPLVEKNVHEVENLDISLEQRCIACTLTGMSSQVHGCFLWNFKILVFIVAQQ